MLVRNLSYVLAFTFMASCSPAPKSESKSEPTALHHAAAALHVLLQNGYEPDTLAHAVTEFQTEYEITKANLSEDAIKKCDHAAAASNSLRQIFEAMVSNDKNGFENLRPELENVGLVKNDKDWNDALEALEAGIPSDLDNDDSTNMRAEMRDHNLHDIFIPARTGTVKTVAACEQAT